MARTQRTNDSLLGRNRRAFHDYSVLDTIECGIELAGSEVKSLRAKHFSFNDAFGRVAKGELWLYNLHITPYRYAVDFVRIDPLRQRRLLAHRREINKMDRHCKLKQATLVPLDIHLSAHNKIKVALGVCVGKKLHDKRQAIKERDARRDMREMQ